MNRPSRILALLLALVLPALASCASEDDDVAEGPPATDGSIDDGTDDASEDDASEDDASEDGSDADAEDGSSLPEGFQSVEGDGVSLAMPQDWQSLDPGSEDFERVLDAAFEANPQMGEALGEQARQLAQQGAVLFAIAPPGEVFSDNVNILEVPGAPPPIDALEGQVPSIVGSMGAELAGTEQVELPAGETLRVEYTLDIPSPATGEQVEAQGFQYYVLHEDGGYVITVTLGPSSDPELADSMAETFTYG